MPLDTPSYCSTPGCGTVVRGGGKCPRCRSRAAARRKAYDSSRPSSSARGYGSEWRKLRERFLASNPHCTARGCYEPATEVDHVVPLSKGGTNDPSNLRAFCKPHHSSRTARDQSKWGGRRQQR